MLATADAAYRKCPEQERDRLLWAFLRSLQCMYHLSTAEFTKAEQAGLEGLEIRLELLSDSDLLIALSYSWLGMAVGGQERYVEGTCLLGKWFGVITRREIITVWVNLTKPRNYSMQPWRKQTEPRVGINRFSMHPILGWKVMCLRQLVGISHSLRFAHEWLAWTMRKVMLTWPSISWIFLGLSLGLVGSAHTAPIVLAMWRFAKTGSEMLCRFFPRLFYDKSAYTCTVTRRRQLWPLEGSRRYRRVFWLDVLTLIPKH